MAVKKSTLKKQLEEQRKTAKIPASFDFGLPEHVSLPLKRLARVKAPKILMALVMLIMLNTQASSLGWLQSFETFAGDAQVTRALRAAGLRSVAYEINYDRDNFDFMGDHGFANCISLALAMEMGGVSVNAPVCSSWVFMSRHSTGRSSWRPLGNRAFENVSTANAMISRMVLLLMVYSSLGICWILEQPAGSLLQDQW